jgi:hypothetical protein
MATAFFEPLPQKGTTMSRRLCCCGHLEFGSVDAVSRLCHLIEVHGLVPRRAPRAGDPVYPRPEFADPTWYRLSKTRSPVRCAGCRRLIEKGELNASQRYSTLHYCTQCVSFAHGAPEAHARMHEHLRRLLNS